MVNNNEKGALVSNSVFGNVVNKGGNKKGELWLTGFVGNEWSEDGIAMRNLKSYCENNGVTHCKINLNTGGGYVSAAMEIAAYMQMTENIEFEVVNVGMVASAGVMILVAADKARACVGSLMMIHDPGREIWGTLSMRDMKGAVMEMEKTKEAIIDIYMGKVRKKKGGAMTDKALRKKMADMMTDETWFTPSESKDWGFVDEVIERGDKMNFSNNSTNVALCHSLNYKNMSTVQEWLKKMTGAEQKTDVIADGAVNDVETALKLLKSKGYEVPEIVQETDEQKAINLLKSKGFKIEGAKNEEVETDEEKAIKMLQSKGFKVEAQKEVSEKEVEPKEEERALNQRITNLESLLTKFVDKMVNGSGAGEGKNTAAGRVTLPPLNLGVGGGCAKDDDDEKKGNENSFGKIKNGKEIEGLMNKVAEAFKS